MLFRSTQHPQRVACDRAFAGEPLQERGTSVRVGKSLGSERGDGGVGRVGGVTEQLFQCRIDDGRFAAVSVGTERPHEHAFVDGVEQTPEGFLPPDVYRDGAA